MSFYRILSLHLNCRSWPGGAAVFKDWLEAEDRDLQLLLPHLDAVYPSAVAGQVGLQRGQGGEVLQHQHRDVPGEAVHHVHGDRQPAGYHGQGDLSEPRCPAAGESGDILEDFPVI